MSVCHKIKSLPDKIIQLQNFIYFLSRHPLKLMPFNVFWYFSALANNSLGTTNIDNLIPFISLHPRGISRKRGCVVVFSTWCYAHTDKLIPTEGIGNPWLNFRIMQSPLLYLSRLSARPYRVHISHWQYYRMIMNQSIIVSFVRVLNCQW